MTSIAVWAIDIIEQHPRISLADFYEQDIASNSLGFFPHRPSLTLMVQVQRFVAERPLREQRKVEGRREFEEWQLTRRIEPSRFSLRQTATVQEDVVLLLDYDDVNGAPTMVGFAIMDSPPPLTFPENSLEARLIYAVFDIFHQRIMSRAR